MCFRQVHLEFQHIALDEFIFCQIIKDVLVKFHFGFFDSPVRMYDQLYSSERVSIYLYQNLVIVKNPLEILWKCFSHRLLFVISKTTHWDRMNYSWSKISSRPKDCFVLF